MHDDLNELRTLRFMPSRIPAQDALETLIQGEERPDAEIQEVMSRTGMSRWYPVEGGHRLLILYEGGPYRPERFTLLKGGWDHEHCSRCRDGIPPMTLCWVTREDPYVLLDEKCYRHVFGDAVAREPLADD